MTLTAITERLPKMAPCWDKLRYYRKRDAKDAVKYYRRNYGWKQEIYWCETHGCYHLTKVRDG